MSDARKETRTCPVCGRQFTPRTVRQRMCSRKCIEHNRRLDPAEDIDMPSLRTVLKAKGKPRKTSAVRWRIEQRRRAAPEVFEYAPPPGKIHTSL